MSYRIEALREQLANLAHEQWSGWTEWMFENWDRGHSSGESFQSRWKRQCVTPYAYLSEEEKASDLVEADKVLAIIGPVLTELQDRVAGLQQQLAAKEETYLVQLGRAEHYRKRAEKAQMQEEIAADNAEIADLRQQLVALREEKERTRSG